MLETEFPLNVQVVSSMSIFPELTQGGPITVPLSIADATSAMFSRCAGIFFYDPPCSPEKALTAEHLRISLSKTLNYYSPWCGRLSFATPHPNSGHTNRYHRINVAYNSPDDVGILFVTATSSKKLSDFLPSISDRVASRTWDASQLKSGELLPNTILSLSSSSAPPDAPNVIIQFTTFLCGSTALAIEITHSLSDAQSLAYFANDWASISRALSSNQPSPILTPVFDPQLLDARATGDIDASTPDPGIQARARGLPTNRYDWYNQHPQAPWPLEVPPEFDPASVFDSPCAALPWEEYDSKAPVSRRIIHFTYPEIQAMYAEARSKNPGSRMSKHDVLAAHVWSRISSSRLLPPGATSQLDISFGFRAHVSPPLPDSFLGSPITIAAISCTPSESPSVAVLASRINSTLQKFTPSAVGDFLHDAAFEFSPTRIGRAFWGQRHTLLTTWVRLGIHDVDFIGDGGPRLRFMVPVMPDIDGLMVLIETVPERREEQGHWTRNGADVILCLEQGTMDRMLKDERLWPKI